MGLFKSKALYDLTVSVVVDTSVDVDRCRESVSGAVLEEMPWRGLDFLMAESDVVESAEGDVILDGKWFFRGRIKDAEIAVSDWHNGVARAEGVQEVMRIVLGGNDGTYAEHFSDKTVNAYNALDDETRRALGPRNFDPDPDP